MSSRKRRRDDIAKLQQYGIDLPDIPGVPVQVIPLHVNALKIGQKFFKTWAEPKFPGCVPRSFQDPNLLGSPNEAADKDSEQAEAARCHDDAVRSWLEALRRQIRDSRHKSTMATATMEHLWDIVCTQKKVSARRSALHMAGHLLSKSAAAREWLLSNENSTLSTWIESLQKSKLIQREAYMLLELLQRGGYGSFYPTLTTALRSLEETYPVQHDPNTLDTTMVNLRRYRDVAITYWEKEATCVEKIIQKIHTCIDRLVPRMGRQELAVDATEDAEPALGLDDDDDDDDEIDWEDGIDGDDGFQTSKDHVADVETTLALMQTRAGGITNGALEIDFDANNESTTITEDTPEASSSRQRLKKLASKLTNTHMPRLSLWVDGLTNADSLTLNETKSSLVRQSETFIAQRQHVLREMIDLKARVASCLESARHLGAANDPGSTGMPSDTIPERASTTPISVNLMTSSRHTGLTSRMSKIRPRSAHRGSNRIKIKFGKR